jgi:hypothetical protein
VARLVVPSFFFKRRTLSAATVITSVSFTMDAAREFQDAFGANDIKRMKSSLQNLNVQVGASLLERVPAPGRRGQAGDACKC